MTDNEPFEVEEVSDPIVDEVVVSDAPSDAPEPTALTTTLEQMGATYREDPVKAVRGQGFIKFVHTLIASELNARLTEFAIKRGITVVHEATILGSTKPKDVDVAVIDPHNGPLMIIGVRSQMSSVGKNVLNYYEGIVGECISLQQRFPMATHGYIYLHPATSIKEGKETEYIDHKRYARMYAAITGRAGIDYKSVRGVFDHFAYMVVDFNSEPPTLLDGIVTEAVPDAPLSITDFTNRMIETFKSRLIFWDVFD